MVEGIKGKWRGGNGVNFIKTYHMHLWNLQTEEILQISYLQSDSEKPYLEKNCEIINNICKTQKSMNLLNVSYMM